MKLLALKTVDQYRFRIAGFCHNEESQLKGVVISPNSRLSASTHLPVIRLLWPGMVATKCTLSKLSLSCFCHCHGQVKNTALNYVLFSSYGHSGAIKHHRN